MATLARPGRPLAPRVQRAYRLEMAGRTVALFLVLLGLTGLVIFYLGVITGKGLRDPNAPLSADGTVPAATPDAKAPAPTALNHALTAPTGQIEGLKQEEIAANQQTQQLLSRAKQELTMEEVTKAPAAPTAPAMKAAPSAPAPATKAVPAPVAARSAASPARRPAVASAARPVPPAAPAAPSPARKPAPVAARSAVTPPAAPAAGNGEGYTVQVFSSPQQQSAQDILTDLKRKGFPAYMNQFQAADKRIWYRVRVGKGSRQEAEALANRLRQSSSLQDMRVLKL